MDLIVIDVYDLDETFGADGVIALSDCTGSMSKLLKTQCVEIDYTGFIYPRVHKCIVETPIGGAELLHLPYLLGMCKTQLSTLLLKSPDVDRVFEIHMRSIIKFINKLYADNKNANGVLILDCPVDGVRTIDLISKSLKDWPGTILLPVSNYA